MPAFTWYSGITSTFAELTTAERVNGDKQTRANESALRSISAIPVFRSCEWKPLTPGQNRPVPSAETNKRSYLAAGGVRDCLVFEGFKTSGKPPAPSPWAWGGFILAEN